MKTALRVVLAVCAIALTCAALLISYDVHYLLVDSDAAVMQTQATVLQVQNAIQQGQTDETVTAQHLNLILAEVEGVTGEAKLAASEQRAAWNKTAVETDKTARAVRMLIDRTDRKLNDGLLPELMQQTDVLAGQADIALISIGHTSDTLNEQLNDPHIMSLASRLDDSAENMSKATASFADASADIRAKVHDLTKPQSKRQKIVSGLKDGGSLGYIALRLLQGWP